MDMQNQSSTIDGLINESNKGLTLTESKVLPNLKFDQHDIQVAKEKIMASSSYDTYHLLFALRRASAADYELIPKHHIAQILCSALEHMNYLNDWGYLDIDESVDQEAALALLETGSIVVNCLRPILDNKQPAPLFGTEEATLSAIYQYRRNDFAYRYISLILGKKPIFKKEPNERDREIEKLKNEL
jgi:hypothetical protein